LVIPRAAGVHIGTTSPPGVQRACRPGKQHVQGLAPVPCICTRTLGGFPVEENGGGPGFSGFMCGGGGGDGGRGGLGTLLGFPRPGGIEGDRSALRGRPSRRCAKGTSFFCLPTSLGKSPAGSFQCAGGPLTLCWRTAEGPGVNHPGTWASAHREPRGDMAFRPRLFGGLDCRWAVGASHSYAGAAGICPTPNPRGEKAAGDHHRQLQGRDKNQKQWPTGPSLFYPVACSGLNNTFHWTDMGE